MLARDVRRRADRCHDAVHGNGFALIDFDLGENARRWRRYLGVDLVGGNLEQRLIPVDGVTVPEVVRELDAAGFGVVDVSLRRPTLDEVFLKLTDRAKEAA